MGISTPCSTTRHHRVWHSICTGPWTTWLLLPSQAWALPRLPLPSSLAMGLLPPPPPSDSLRLLLLPGRLLVLGASRALPGTCNSKGNTCHTCKLCIFLRLCRLCLQRLVQPCTYSKGSSNNQGSTRQDSLLDMVQRHLISRMHSFFQRPSTGSRRT